LKLVWSGPARRDITRLIDPYGAIDPKLALRLVALIEVAPSALLEHPKMAPRMPHSRTRKWPIHGTPFLLFFTATRTHLHIKRIRHERENWLKRS
jgi:plasmid stabilization system protein ParE